MPDLSKLHNLAGQLRDHAAARRRAATAAVRPRWYDVKNQGGAVASVYLYDMIGDDGWGGGISAQSFVDEIGQIAAPAIELHINSEGGEVFDGIAIYEALKQHPAIVAVVIDSLAASAASFIAMAADPYDQATQAGGVRMARNARMMIHDAAMGGAYGAGNAADLRDFAADVLKMATVLDDMSMNIADIYAQRAGGTPESWRDLMLAETWFSAAQAKAAGLIDSVMGQEQETTAAPVEDDTIITDALDVEAILDALKGAWNA